MIIVLYDDRRIGRQLPDRLSKDVFQSEGKTIPIK